MACRRILIGALLSGLLAFIIIGDVNRISKIAEFVSPIMAGLYILMTLIIIGMNFQQIPALFSLIFKSALNLEASFGGIIGTAIAWGVKRGIYSNAAVKAPLRMPPLLHKFLIP